MTFYTKIHGEEVDYERAKKLLSRGWAVYAQSPSDHWFRVCHGVGYNGLTLYTLAWYDNSGIPEWRVLNHYVDIDAALRALEAAATPGAPVPSGLLLRPEEWARMTPEACATHRALQYEYLGRATGDL